jgi:hypothetical protein
MSRLIMLALATTTALSAVAVAPSRSRLADRAVPFRDTCTNDVAVAAPEQSGSPQAMR